LQRSTFRHRTLTNSNRPQFDGLAFKKDATTGYEFIIARNPNKPGAKAEAGTSANTFFNRFFGLNAGPKKLTAGGLEQIGTRIDQKPDPDRLKGLEQMKPSMPWPFNTEAILSISTINFIEETISLPTVDREGTDCIFCSAAWQGKALQLLTDARNMGLLSDKLEETFRKLISPFTGFGIAMCIQAEVIQQTGWEQIAGNSGAGYGIKGQAAAEGRLLVANQAIFDAAAEAAYTEGTDPELLACRYGQLCRTLYGQEPRQITLENWATRKLEAIKQPNLFDTKTMQIGSADC